MLIVVIFSYLILSFFYARRILYMTHIFQLEEYKQNFFLKWKQENANKIYPKSLRRLILLMPVVYFLSLALCGLLKKNICFFIFAPFVLIYLFFYHTKPIKNPKKPLSITPRIKRLLLSNGILYLILSGIVSLYAFLNDDQNGIYWMAFMLFMVLIYYFALPIFTLATKIQEPIENKIKDHYFKMAQQKLKRFPNIKVVAITGSYGKTSTKFFAAEILSAKYRVLKTPESYNTPMGISKVINNHLTGEEEVFVVEMGARKRGEIEELCSLAPPQYSIITSIGAAHLETFGSIKEIEKAKYEIITALPKEGVAIFNGDNKYTSEMYERTKHKKYQYSISKKADIYATEIAMNERGAQFKLNIRDQEPFDCETKLLGKHNILNILAGVCVAVDMGLSSLEIQKGIAKIEPVPHRLQLIDPQTGILVIDDAFNANPDGARAALEVLSQYKERRKIIVTPGMIELGKKEYEENYQLGVEISKVCDIAILIGPTRTQPIQEGLKKGGLGEDNCYILKSLSEASSLLAQIGRAGDVVLFENDLPDSLSE